MVTKAQAVAAAVRADADDKVEEREDADAGTQLKTMIADMTKMMDSVCGRMDAMEKREDERKADAARKDEDDKDEKKSDGEEDKDEKKSDGEDDEVPKEPERVAADKKKDNDEDVSEAKAAADKKKDAEDDDEDDKRDDGAKADAADMTEMRAQMAVLQRRLGDLTAITPKPMTDADHAAVTDAQALADSVFTEFGRHAPRPLVNEDVMSYRRRVARDLRQYSPALKDVNLYAVADSVAFEAIERQIYADALGVARAPVNVPAGELRPISRRSGGHEITEYAGEPGAWMTPMSGNVSNYVTEIAN